MAAGVRSPVVTAVLMACRRWTACVAWTLPLLRACVGDRLFPSFPVRRSREPVATGHRILAASVQDDGAVSPLRIHDTKEMHMERRDNEVSKTRKRRAAAGGRFARMTMMMALAVLASLPAQAEPGAASQALNAAKSHMQNLQSAYQAGRSYALGGHGGLAYPLFRGAHIQSVGLCDRAANLQTQNRDTLNRGLFRNRSYQQQAVQLSDTLRSQCGELSYRLSLLVINPLAYQQIAVVDGAIPPTAHTLSQLEQAMTLAQR
jgi:hypothetical protein